MASTEPNQLPRTIERLTLATWGAVAGTYSVLAVLIPQRLAKAVFDRGLPPVGLLLHELLGGMQLGLAVVAIVLARMPRPARSLVRAVALGLACSLAGALFAGVTNGVSWPELRSYAPLLGLDLAAAVILLVTQLLR